MNPNQLEKLRTTRPFEPFTIHMSDGTSYPVPSPEYIMRTKSGRTMAVLADGGDVFAILDMIHVTRLTTPHEIELAVEEPRR